MVSIKCLECSRPSTSDSYDYKSEFTEGKEFPKVAFDLLAMVRDYKSSCNSSH
jgi:DNA-directed RNA polymerase subunit N (RpoN/RPB10)